MINLALLKEIFYSEHIVKLVKGHFDIKELKWRTPGYTDTCWIIFSYFSVAVNE